MAGKLCLNSDCFGCSNGKCAILIRTADSGQECKFYKTLEQIAKERRKTIYRLHKIGKDCLIEYYWESEKDYE